MFNFKHKQSIASYNEFKARAPSLLLSSTSFPKPPPQEPAKSTDQELSQWPKERTQSQLLSQQTGGKAMQNQNQKFVNQLSAILEEQAFYFKQENKRVLKPLKQLQQNLADFEQFLDSTIQKLTDHKNTLVHNSNSQLELSVNQLVALLRNKHRPQVQRSSVSSLSPEGSQHEGGRAKSAARIRGGSTKKQKKGGKKKAYTKKRN